MNSLLLPPIFLLIFAPPPSILASNRCVKVVGQLKCVGRGPEGVLGAQVSVFDKDFVGIFKFLDTDDRMGMTNIMSEDGKFEVRGCADDHNWLPFYENEIEPFLRIFHFCNREGGEDSEWRYDSPFTVFEPRQMDAGVIILDDLHPY